MSSHHIIREKQEPALYIHRLGDFDEEYLGQLLEWSPTLIVSEAEYEKAVSLDLKVDLLVGSNEPIPVQEDTAFISAGTDSLAAVLDYLVEARYPAVNIIDTRLDLISLTDYIEKINIVLFTGGTKSYAIRSGFEVWKPKGHRFQTDTIDDIEITNVHRKGEGVAETLEDGFVKFTFAKPYIIISELL
jgi:thiamine pyrophosphokinase